MIAKIELGGQERTINFETMGFLKHLGEITSQDPLDIFSDGFSNDPGKAYKVHLAIIHAGLLAQCDVDSVTAAFTRDDVDKWLSVVPVRKMEGLVVEAYAAMTGKTVDDLKKLIAQAAVKNGMPVEN